ncbi:hypothetical protein [Agromyces larvae]|uniref:Polysaccharide chain length determinant N-terminal domain-containing protein n=1 Tax=Agromyces larvae TaxID=2929802 RepID=A0ABY4BY07_9MICO|nr:hypothetical protein [Agromyces larvae]UOE42751.1 hypothetical protein MTO99_11170 [Agromyces larvae]
MNPYDVVRAIARRWYIPLAGVVIGAVLAIVAWSVVQPTYERSASQLLLPGESSVPDGDNPYLYIGGIGPAGDVLVRSIASTNALNDLEREFPGAEVAVGRDPTTSAPVINITVTARSDDEAAQVLDLFVKRTSTVLEDLQAQERIPEPDRITVIPITVDSESVLRQKERMMVTVAAGAIPVVLSAFVAALVDGLIVARSRRRRSPDDSTDETTVRGPADSWSADGLEFEDSVETGYDTLEPVRSVRRDE